MNLRNLYASCWTCWLGLNWNWNIATLWRSNSGSLQDELLKSSLAFHHFDFSTAQLWLNLLISFKSNSLLLSIYQLFPILFYSLNTFFSLYPIPPLNPLLSTLFFYLFPLFPSQASHSSSPSSSSSSSLSCHLQPSVAAMEEAGSGLGLSMSVSNSYLIGQASLTTPTVSFRQTPSIHHPFSNVGAVWS